MSLHTPQDQINVGDYVIQTEPQDLGERVSGGVFAAATVTRAFDRSFMHEPWLVVAVELPYIAVVDRHGRSRHCINLREVKMRVLSESFVIALRGGQQ